MMPAGLPPSTASETPRPKRPASEWEHWLVWMRLRRSPVRAREIYPVLPRCCPTQFLLNALQTVSPKSEA
jgi:hypothetical protein